MARYRTANQYVVLLRENFYNAEGLNLYAVATHTASHAHPFEHAARI